MRGGDYPAGMGEYLDYTWKMMAWMPCRCTCSGRKEPEMFVEGYKAVLVKDTSFKGLWKVSFTLREF